MTTAAPRAIPTRIENAMGVERGGHADTDGDERDDASGHAQDVSQVGERGHARAYVLVKRIAASWFSRGDIRERRAGRNRCRPGWMY